MPDAEYGTGMKRFWDGEDCPHDGCDGELQHQDQYNVMCLSCESSWSDVRQPATDSSPETHLLQGADGDVAAEKPAVATDGGEHSEFGKQHWMDIDITEHYRQKSRREEMNFVAAGGILIGIAGMALFMLLWEVIRR